MQQLTNCQRYFQKLEIILIVSKRMFSNVFYEMLLIGKFFSDWCLKIPFQVIDKLQELPHCDKYMSYHFARVWKRVWTLQYRMEIQVASQMSLVISTLDQILPLNDAILEVKNATGETVDGGDISLAFCELGKVISRFGIVPWKHKSSPHWDCGNLQYFWTVCLKCSFKFFHGEGLFFSFWLDT